MFYLYLLTKLDFVRNLLIVPSIIFLVFAVILPLIVLDDHGKSFFGESLSDSHKITVKFVKRGTIVSLICLFIGGMLPSTKEAAFIYVGDKLLKSEKIQEIGVDALNLSGVLMKYANEYVSDKIEKKKDTE